MSDFHWTGASSDTYNVPENWLESSVPGAGDNAIFDGAISNNPCHLGGAGWAVVDFTFINYTGTFTFAATYTIAGDFTMCPGMTLAGTGAISVGGSVFFANGMTRTYTGTITLNGTSGTHFLTTNGVALDNSITIDGAGGTWKLGSNLLSGATRTLTVTRGVFDRNGFDIEIGNFSSNNANTRSFISLGAGTITLLGTTTAWIVTSTLNLQIGETVIRYANNSATTKSFTGGGLTYYKLVNATANTGALNITGSNTFLDGYYIEGVARTTRFGSASVNTAKNWGLSGTAGNLNTIAPVTAANTYTLVSSGNAPVSLDYISISYAICSPVPPGWFAGTHSTDGTNNVGIFFNAPPSRGLVSIAKNGSFPAAPAHKHRSDILNVGTNDLDEIQTVVNDYGWLQAINMSADFNDRVWEMVKTFIAATSTRTHTLSGSGQHWTGFNSDGTLSASRALQHIQALAGDGLIRAWGDTDQTGVVTAISALSAVTGYQKLAVGNNFVAVINTDGDIECYGAGAPSGLISAGADYFVDVACGTGHLLARKNTGVVIAAGVNTSGQCELPAFSSEVIALAGGSTFSAALMSDGTIQTWGAVPAGVSFDPSWNGRFVRIAAGSTHLIGILDDGSVVCWGDNTGGKCNVPSLTGKRPIRVWADSVRSYLAHYVAGPNDNANIQTWGASITLGAVANYRDGFASIGYPQFIGTFPQTSIPAATLISNPGDNAPVGLMPAIPAGQNWVDIGMGDRFGVCISRHHWSCGVMSNTLKGLCNAYGIHARQVSGTGFPGCHGDTLVEIWVQSLGERGKWVLIFTTAGVWGVGADGLPMSYADWRAHHAAGNYRLEVVYRRDVGGVALKLVPLNGSGISLAPRDHFNTMLYPSVKGNGFSEDLLPSPWASGKFDYGHTTSDSRLNNATPQSTRVLYDDHTALNAAPPDGCGLSITGSVVADTDLNLTYPLNQVRAQAVLFSDSPASVEIRLTENMSANTGGVPDTGGFDHYEAQINGGAWAAIGTLLTDIGGGVFHWFPAAATESLKIRGENAADVHSNYVVMNYQDGSLNGSAPAFARRRGRR